MTYRLGLTAIGQRVTMSKRSKNNSGLAIGKIIDCHNDFIHCVMQWTNNQDQIITDHDGKKYILTRREYKEELNNDI
jgi:hypothetical protein